MKLLMRRVLFVVDKVNDALAVFATCLLVFISVTICVNAITRIWHIYWLGLVEIARFSLVWITFCGAAWLLRRGEGHISVDAVTSRLPPKTRALINVITGIVSLTTFSFFAWYSAKLTLYHLQINFFIADSILRPPKAPFEIIIPLGCFLLAIELLRKTYRKWAEWKSPGEEGVKPCRGL